MAFAAGVLGVGVILDHLSNRVEGMIGQLGQEGRAVTLTFGAELRNTIDSARSAYQNCLGETLDQVRPEVAGTIRQLQDLVDRFQDRNDAFLRNLGSEAQIIASTLPLHTSCPQVREVSPRFLVLLDPNRVVFIDVFGHFEHASSPNYPHTLTFNGHNATLADTAINKLRYRISFNHIFPQGTVKDDELCFSTGELKASWPGAGVAEAARGLWRNLVGGQAPNVRTFKITLGVLPAFPGEITLQYTTMQEAFEEQEHRSGEKHLSSCREGGSYIPNVKTGGHNSDESMDFSEQPTEGWEVKPKSKKFVSINTPNGGVNTELTFLSEEKDEVRFRCRTWHSRFGHSGIINFRVSFIERRKIGVDDAVVNQKVSLGWEESHTFTPAKNWKKDDGGFYKWKVIFKPFDADPKDPPLEYTSTVKTPRLVISPDGFGVKITPRVPRELAE